MAFARQGDGDKAVRLLRMLNPVEHARDEQDYERYKVEPYVMAGDVYALEGHVGRGGWTWYTGAAGWIYRVWLEEVLGFKRRGDRLTIKPVIPKDWPGFRLRYRFRTPVIASRSRIQTTVPVASPWWNWMESRQPTKSSRCVTTRSLTRCVLSWEPNRRREDHVLAPAFLFCGRSEQFGDPDNAKPHLLEVRRRVPPAPPVSFSLQLRQVLHRPQRRRLGRCCDSIRSISPDRSCAAVKRRSVRDG